MSDELTDHELQSLRNMGNEAERAADEITHLRAALAAAQPPSAMTEDQITLICHALVRARDGFMSENATGLVTLEMWRNETLTKISQALAVAAYARAAPAAPALHTAIRLVLEATPEQLPLALDALRDIWGGAAHETQNLSDNAQPVLVEVERCKCGYQMPCALKVPIGFCRA